MKRTTSHKQALAIIRYEYATCGKETRESMRAYMENRISFESRLKAVREDSKKWCEVKSI